MSIHGGNIVATARELGCSVNDLVDMSSNLTPLGTAPGVQEALVATFEQIAYLPETASSTLVDSFARRYGLQPAMVLAGNGTTEFIFALPRLFNHCRGLIVTPTYSDYRLACQWAGLNALDLPLDPAHGFAFDFDKLKENIQADDFVFICNPNNPTGGMISSEELYNFIKDHPDTFFLVDESYLPFVPEKSILDFPVLDNLFLLSSFSKIYGIPGLRLGFLVSSEKNIKLLQGQSKPWGVNRPAQIAGEYLIDHADDYVAEVRDFVARERPGFTTRLASLPGIEVVPGVANFILCHLQGNFNAEDLRLKMLSQRIMIRNCASFAGLDNRYFRLSLKDRSTNDYCLRELTAVLEDKSCE